MRLGKRVLTDTDITARRFRTGDDGKVRDVEEYTVPIKGGSMVLIDITALHMNREALPSLNYTAPHVILSNPLG